MRKRLAQPPPPARALNVTPLIDVVMCLIIFYLIVGHLVSQRRTPIDLPQARHGVPLRPEEPFVVNIRARDGATSVVVQQETLSPDDLAHRLRQRLDARPDTVVQIRAARSLPFGSVAPVITACRRAGARTIRLAAEPAP